MALCAGKLVGLVSLMAFTAVKVAQVIFVHIVGLHLSGALSQSRIVAVTSLALLGFDALSGRRFLVARTAGQSLGRMTIS